MRIWCGWQGVGNALARLCEVSARWVKSLQHVGYVDLVLAQFIFIVLGSDIRAAVNILFLLV